MGNIEFLDVDEEEDFRFLEVPIHPSVIQLAQYWEAKREGKTMPDRADISPTDIVELLPNFVLYEATDHGRDYRVRIFGTALVDLVGEERTGMLLSQFGSDCSPPTRAMSVRKRWLDSTQAAVETCRPAFVTGRMSSSQRSYITWHGVSCPLTNKASDGRNDIRQIMGIMVTDRPS